MSPGQPEAYTPRDGDTAVEAAEAFAVTSPEITRSRTLTWQDPVPTAAAGATMTGIEYGANFTFVTPYGDFDVLVDATGMPHYEELKAAAIEREAFGHLIKVASIDHLIAMKRAANRPKDQLMVEEHIVIADEQQRIAEEGE
jgi:hypothetical protein